MIISNKLREAYYYILAEEENFPFEKRMFMSSVLIGILTGAIGTIGCIFLTSDIVSVILGILVTVFLSVIYYFVRFKGIYKPFIVPIILVSFIAISLLWMFGGGMDGPNIMVAFVILILSFTVISDKNKKYFLYLFITLVFTIYLLQLIRPGLITAYRSETARWVDYLFTTLYSSFLMFLIIKFLHKNYTIERNRAKENEKKFRALSENSEDLISRIDRQYRFTYVNNAGLTAMGLRAGQILGKSFRETGVYSDEQTGMFEKTVEAVFVSKQPQFKQYNIKSEQGQSFYDWRLFPEFDDNDEVISVLGVSHDITHLKQAENQLLKLNADKDLFISILAHDLKSPFNTILGFSEILLEKLRTYDLDTIEEQLGYIHASSQRTYNLLEDLLLWAQSQSGKLDFKPQKIDFGKICREIVDKSRTDAIAKNISLTYFPDGEITLLADEYMLKTVLRNLLSNAIKFTRSGGEIQIRASQTDSVLAVTVSDNGVGIAPETAKNLFDISNRVTTYGTANEKGTGLGLLLCKEFVEKHHGNIWVESVPGKGSEFKFTLPV